MALWTYRLDALDLNDHVNFSVTGVPQVDDPPPGENILVQNAGDYPDFVRWQPVDGLLAVNILVVQSVSGRMMACTEAQWAQRMDTLRAVLTPGLHTFTAQARGWTAEKSVQVLYRSLATNYKLREVSLELTVPKPVWT